LTVGQHSWHAGLKCFRRGGHGRETLESALHRMMKECASRELTSEGYSVFEEPPYAPSSFISWSSYRPDLFGLRAGGGVQDYVLVECETRPSERKLAAKNFKSVEVQARLSSDVSLRRVLVIPRGNLACLDTSVRTSWEMWIYEGGSFQMFPQAASRQTV